jgi:hypothetical protein
MHPNGHQIIFSSNLPDSTRRTFALCLINIDGTGMERTTCGDTFANYPIFSPNGMKRGFALH